MSFAVTAANILMRHQESSGTPIPPVDTWVPPLLLGADTVFFFSSSRTKTLFQEVNVASVNNAIGVPLTRSTTDGNSVGFMYDCGPNALKATAADNTVKPTLTSGNGRNTGFDFATQYLRISNSQSILKNFNKSNTAFSIFCWAKKDVDGTNMCMMANIPGSTLNHGIFLGTTTGNRINILISWGSSGNASVNYTTTASFTVAMGWQPIIVTIAGAGAGQGSIHIGSTVETFTVDNEGSTTNATGLMTFGASSALASFYNGQMDNFGAQNRVLTAAELTNYKTYNPARDSSNFYIKEIEYDFNSATNLWADTAKTIPITDNTGIAAVTNKLPTNFGPRTDDMTQSTSGSRPLYQSNVVNGLGVAEYDGTDDTLVLSELTERGGAWVIYVIVKQEDLTNGSHVAFSGGNVYWTLTGLNYAGASLTNPYSVIHHAIGSDSAGQEASPTNTYTVLAFRRDGSETTLFTDKFLSMTITSLLQFSIGELGRDAFGVPNNWMMDGNYAKFIKYNGYKTDVEILAEIASLVDTFN
jgi:hypothetical protein